MFRVMPVTLVVTFFLSAAPARADGSLGDALKGVALDIKKFLDARGEVTVALGAFRGTGVLAIHSSAGPLLVQGLERFLKDLAIEVRRKSNITILGEFFEAETEEKALQVIVLEVELRDPTGQSYRLGAKLEGKKKRYDYVIKEQAAVASIVGVNTFIPPDATKEQRNDYFKKQIDNPEPYLTGSLIRAKGAPFAIEILATANKPGKRKDADYQVRFPVNNDGLPFVGIKRDEVYGVRLVNEADFDVAFDLRIDGLSMFVFSQLRDKKTGAPLYRYMVLPKKSHVLIRGWHVSNNDSDEFLVTEYAKSAAAQFPTAANVGTITVNWFRAWPKGEPRPTDEPINPDKHSQSADATGRGQRFQQEYHEVEYNVGVLRASVSVRYTK